MKAWDIIGRDGAAVMRTASWQAELGDAWGAWSGVLDVVSPKGRRFFADFGGGRGEFEVREDEQGLAAMAVEGGAQHRLNPTEGEFRKVGLERVMKLLKEKLQLDGDVEPRARGVVFLGRRTLGGKKTAFFAVTRTHVLHDDTERLILRPDASVAEVSAALVPSPEAVRPQIHLALSAARIGILSLPNGAPWRVPLAPLAENADLGFTSVDPMVFYGDRVIVVSKSQKKIWFDGKPLGAHPEKQAYRVLAYLADRPGETVPDETLVWEVIEPSGKERADHKVVSDAKDQLIETLDKCGKREPITTRVLPSAIVVREKGSLRLALQPADVKVLP